jgi:hypothetical protein
MPSSIAAPIHACALAQLPPQVRTAFEAVPPEACGLWLQLRTIIFDVARDNEADPLTETLKWAEPSYSTPGGTPIRLGWKPVAPGTVKLLVHCQTSLVAQWRELYTDTLQFEGTRAMLLDVGKALPRVTVTHCVAMALTYKRRK